MNWRDKSKDSDLFFCTNVECNVITFRPPNSGRNTCPKCWREGALVRTATMMDKGIREDLKFPAVENPA